MKKLLSSLLALGLVAPSAEATWSILVLDHATGEVAIASATCIANFALEDALPVLVVGKGAMAAQSAVDAGAGNRTIGWDLLMDGATPDDVLDALLTIGSAPNSRQYGIVAFSGPAATYSGSIVGEGIGNIVGTSGTLSYAIQGNVLTGNEVCFAAEEALLATPGDLSQKVMAAMDAARDLGGDGRCSCNSGPTDCGAPPASFTKSAHCAFVFLAREGDTDGGCDSVSGCATGDYYLRIAYSGSATDPDPVDVLEDQYDAWRAALAGRPDALLSTVELSAARVPADGATSSSVTVGLVDVDGNPLTTGGATLTVSLAAGSVGDATVGPVVDNGDGSYTFDVTAGAEVGVAELVIVADDGVESATLVPHPTVALDAVSELHVGFDAVDPFLGEDVPLTLNVPAAAGGQALVLATLSGTVPGTNVNGVLLPLNFDDVLLFTLTTANTGPLQGTFTTLDGSGRAQAVLAAPPGFLLPAAGMRLDWAALTLTNGNLAATNATGFDVVSG